jgi:hypothetical protein
MHKIRIAYYKFKTSPSKIAAHITERLGKDSCSLDYYTGDMDISTENSDFLVNWGYAGRVWKTHRCPDINNRNTLENKGAQKRALVAARVRSPKVFEVGEFPNVPVVVRMASHHGGNDAIYVETKEEWDKIKHKYYGGYATEFVDKVAEYRVHSTMISGALYATRKCIKNKGLLCWNNANERVLGSRETDRLLLRRLALIGKKAIKAIGYDFGAVDVMMDEAGMLWVIEVNSAPALENDEAVRVYADFIIKSRDAANYEV